MQNYRVTKNEINSLKRSIKNSVRREFKRLLYEDVEEPEVYSLLETLEKDFELTNRPLLMGLSCEAVGGKFENTILASLIITLAGIGVGIHDDIVDKSINKNFTETIPSRYNDYKSLLIGDLLIVKGLTSVQRLIKEITESQIVVDILEILHRHYVKICEGVFMEKSWIKSIDVDLDDCRKIIENYASDGEACTKIGATLGNGLKKEIQALANFGKQYCCVVRYQDEMLDLYLDENDLIRRLKYENIPLPLLYVARNSGEKIKQKIKSILSKPIVSSDLKILRDLCEDFDGIKYVHEIAEESIKKGIRALDTLKASKAKDYLKFILMDNWFTNASSISDLEQLLI